MTNPMKEGFEELWTIHADGSSNLIGSRVGLILIGLGRSIIKYVLHFKFLITNKEVEYETLATGLNKPKSWDYSIKGL